MKCLVLAAGYATRLYPLTQNYPKPLLMVGEKNILDWLLDDLNEANVINEFIVVTNHKFVSYFNNWAKSKQYKITVVDDGTSTNETRLGAVKDIKYAVNLLKVDDDLMVLAGDNVLDFSLKTFLNYCLNKKTSCVMRYFEEDTDTLSKRGILEFDIDELVLSMEEKPKNPKTQWCCPPFYFYTKEDLKLIDQALLEGCGYDAPGSYISWLVKRRPIHAMAMPGSRYDIGNLESYEKVKKIYKGVTR